MCQLAAMQKIAAIYLLSEDYLQTPLLFHILGYEHVKNAKRPRGLQVRFTQSQSWIRIVHFACYQIYISINLG